MKLPIRHLTLSLIGAGLAAHGLVAAADDPAKQPDESWVSVSGTVVAASEDQFKLDYGSGLITVEMDGWGWYENDHAIIEGDEVTVHGRVDDGLFEQRTIEAGSVYVEDLKTYFHANTADEEGDTDYVVTYTVARPAADGAWLNITGVVEDVDGREFTLSTAGGDIQVDTRAMTYNPLDDQGFQRLDRGDVVSVTGVLDVGFFERREIVADTIYSMDADIKKREANVKKAEGKANSKEAEDLSGEG